MNEVFPDLTYRHFKGGLYTVIAKALDVDHKTQVVVYKSIKDGEIYTRNFQKFIENIRWPDGQIRPRFSLNFNFTKIELDTLDIQWTASSKT